MTVVQPPTGFPCLRLCPVGVHAIKMHVLFGIALGRDSATQLLGTPPCAPALPAAGAFNRPARRQPGVVTVLNVPEGLPGPFVRADLNELIDWSAVECLNQKPSHRIDNALKQVGT